MQIQLSFDVPDAQMPRVQAALHSHFGQVDDGNGGLRDMTSAEITERFRKLVINTMKNIVVNHETQIAMDAVRESIEAVTVD